MGLVIEAFDMTFLRFNTVNSHDFLMSVVGWHLIFNRIVVVAVFLILHKFVVCTGDEPITLLILRLLAVLNRLGSCGRQFSADLSPERLELLIHVVLECLVLSMRYCLRYCLHHILQLSILRLHSILDIPLHNMHTIHSCTTRQTPRREDLTSNSGFFNVGSETFIQLIFSCHIFKSFIHIDPIEDYFSLGIDHAFILSLTRLLNFVLFFFLIMQWDLSTGFLALHLHLSTR